MLANQRHRHRVKTAGIGQDVCRKGNLADVVDHRSRHDAGLLLGREVQLSGDQSSEVRDAQLVPIGVGVAKTQESTHRAHDGLQLQLDVHPSSHELRNVLDVDAAQDVTIDRDVEGIHPNRYRISSGVEVEVVTVRVVAVIN